MNATAPRALAFALLLALAAAACATAAPGDTTDAGTPGPEPVEQVTSSARDVTLSALDDPAAPGLPTPLVDPVELRSGGPPPDGIPSIDDPKFLDVADVGFLEPAEPVLALSIDGDARAYPIQIMVWHEIVNDTVAGVPVAVTYCPLCNSAVAMNRRVRDKVLEFGTSGLLYQSALVMYDRQTESLWSHFTGQAIAGELTGEELEFFPVATVAWDDWRKANPNGRVLSRDTGVSRDYGRSPYPGYDSDSESQPFLFDGEVDSRLDPKARIVGIVHAGHAIAVVHETLLKQRVITVERDGSDLVVWLTPGAVSALDHRSVAEGRDVGSTGAFIPHTDGRRLTFQPSGDGFTDEQTGSQWNVLGEAVAGPLQGQRLQAVTHLDTFWFAWAAFQPDTRIIR